MNQDAGQNSPDKPTTRGAKERSAARRVRALSLRQAGASFRDIGNQLSVSRQQAYRDVDQALTELAQYQRQKAEKLRALELARLDRLLLGVWPRAQGGDLGAVDRAVKIVERIDRLLGLDAPSQVEHSGYVDSTPMMILGHQVDVQKMLPPDLESLIMAAARRLGPEVVEGVRDYLHLGPEADQARQTACDAPGASPKVNGRPERESLPGVPLGPAADEALST